MTVEVIFSHAGSMFAYYLGIAEVLQKYDLSDVVFSGTSGGCFPCILLNSKNDIREFFEDILNCVKTSKDSWENVIRDFLTEYLSEDDIEANKGKFTCKLTKLNDFFLPEKVKVSKWTDKQDFVDCIVASCYVPIMCGNKFYIEYRDQKIVDGFFSGASNEPEQKINIYCSILLGLVKTSQTLSADVEIVVSNSILFSIRNTYLISFTLPICPSNNLTFIPCG